MWTREQGQRVGLIVNEYKNNPSNQKYKMQTSVKENAAGEIVLLIDLTARSTVHFGENLHACYNIDAQGQSKLLRQRRWP